MSDARILTGGGPTVSGLALVSADQTSIEGSGTGQDPLRVRGVGYVGTNVSATTLRRCAAVTPATGAVLAINPLPVDGSQFSGLVIGVPPTPGPHFLPPGYHAGLLADQSGPIQTGGIFTATTADWDAVTGGSGGLSAGAFYYASQATAGHLTATPPTPGQTSVPIGVALDTTRMLLMPGVATIAE